MHIQKRQTRRTDDAFHFDDDLLRVADSYRYLGLNINEFVNFSYCASILHDAGSRALGALVSKHYTSKGFDYKVFEKLYKSIVVPVIDYSADVWGYKTFDSHEGLHHKAVRTFLGAGKQTLLAALDGDVAWNSPKLRRHVDMITLWCRLVKMDHTRLPFKALKYEMQTSLRVRSTWAREI